jgi:YegS/Rv2252/BmrU family lipid kinase
MNMEKEATLLTLIVFNDPDGATKALEQLQKEKKSPGLKSAVIVQKDRLGKLSVKDIGLTPGKGAAAGILLGAALGVLSGGATLALGAVAGMLGGLIGRHSRRQRLAPDLTRPLSEALKPGCSAILGAGEQELPEAIANEFSQLGAELISIELTDEVQQVIKTHRGEAYQALENELKQSAAAVIPSEPLYKRIFVVINPASGKDVPILNTINDVFRSHGIGWEVGITHKYGDARLLARRAVQQGYDLVAGYGGDGTQHEVANALIGVGDELHTHVPMGVLPGGTGNGFCRELGLPDKLRPALEVICASRAIRHVDVVRLGEEHFIQRLYVGIEPEEQTSRELKDHYGTLAYAISSYQRLTTYKDIQYRIHIDGEVIETPATKVYVVNASQSGTGISVTGDLSRSDDGLLEIFILDRQNLMTMVASAQRLLNLHTEVAKQFFWRGKDITIETEPDQPVWTDGEYYGRTPVSMRVLQGKLSVVVAE